VRVGFYVENYLAGGLERFLFDILNALPRDRFDVTVFHGGDVSFADRLASSGAGDLKLVRVPIFSTRRLENAVWARRPPKTLWKIFLLGVDLARWLFAGVNIDSCRRALREHPVDVLCAINGGYPGAMSCLSAVVAARREGVRRTALCLTGVPRRRRWPILEWIVDGRVESAADRIISVCEASVRLAEARRGFSREKQSVVYPAIAAIRTPDAAAVKKSREAVAGARGPVIGNISALEYYKGHRFLVEAVALLKPRYPDMVCVIVGGGAEAEELRRLAEASGVAGNVVFTGFLRGDAAPMISAMDVFVHPTLEDSFPYVVQEAMALGRPIVATAVGGIPEQIVDGESGRVVPPGDARALADAVRELLDDPARARSFAENAAARRERLFSVGKMIKGVIEALDPTAAARSGG
jgi:glycosyltransferase involved in cell wall biosynthesis